ncbi:hypothetical protein T484DRAFT_3260145 [Baffinella frigidus]|nr:hypothetical protein T484DRAFT_3260145 [Cryptophyta sp. CCMP2293]
MDGKESLWESSRTAVLHRKHDWLLTRHDGTKRWYHCRQCDYSGDRLYHCKMHYERIHVNQGKAMQNKRKYPNEEEEEESTPAAYEAPPSALPKQQKKKQDPTSDTRNTNAEVQMLLAALAREIGVDSLSVDQGREVYGADGGEEETSEKDEPAEPDNATSSATAVLLGARERKPVKRTDAVKRGKYQRSGHLSDEEVLEIFFQRPKISPGTGRMVRGGMIEAKAIAVDYGATVKVVCEIWRGLQHQEATWPHCTQEEVNARLIHALEQERSDADEQVEEEEEDEGDSHRSSPVNNLALEISPLASPPSTINLGKSFAKSPASTAPPMSDRQAAEGLLMMLG